MTRQSTLGDILDDLNTLASATSSYGDTGSLGPWLSQQLTAFNQLPSTLPILKQQVANVQQVLTAGGAANTAASDDVMRAATLVAGVEQNYPAAAQQVNTLTVHLLPIMPKLYQGQMDGDVVGLLIQHGTEILATLHVVTSLLADRDNATVLVQQAAADPTLSPTLRDQAMSALANASGSAWLKYAIAGGVAWVVLRGLFGRH